MPSSTRPSPPATDRSSFPPARDRGRLTRRGAVAGAAGAAAAATVAASSATATAATTATRRRTSAREATTASATLPDAAAIAAEGRDLVDHEMIEFAALLRAGETSSVEVTQAYLDRIRTFNGNLETYGNNYGYNAFVRIDEEGALAAAGAADARIATERRGGAAAPWLCGMPFGFKDSIAVKGLAAMNGTLAFAGNVAQEDALAVELLRAHGVVPVGMTICSSFSSSIIGSYAGNAWDYTRVPGGSSQGSGVAPVARLIAGTLGEETGGSIQIPASVNGATAIKPSTGVVPNHGLMPLTPGVDVLGPMVRSARDAALTLNAISRADPRDPQTYQAPRPFGVPVDPRPGDQPLAGLRIGIPKQDWTTVGTGTDPQSTYQAGHLTVFQRVRGELEAMGATIVEFPWIGTNFMAQDPYFRSTASVGSANDYSYTATTATSFANRAEHRMVEAVAAFAQGKPPGQRALLTGSGTYAVSGSFDTMLARHRAVTMAMRAESEARRRQLVWHCRKSMMDAGVDFMLVMNTPSTPTTSTIPIYRRDYQLPNHLGWPMINFPAGSVSGLPSCVAFWGPRFSEPEIVQAAIDYQARHPQWHQARPADPWDASTAAKRRAAQSTNRVDDATFQELLEKERDPRYSTDTTVSPKGEQE